MQIVTRHLRDIIWPIFIGIFIGASVLYALYMTQNYEVKVSKKTYSAQQQYKFERSPVIEFSGAKYAIMAVMHRKDPKQRKVIIKNLGNQKISTVGVGELAFNGQKIIKITRDCITLDDRQRTIVISLPQSTPAGHILNRLL